MNFTRITINPRRMDGMPCIRGLQIPAAIVAMVTAGMSTEEFLKAYPDLPSEDVPEALKYAAEAAREKELPVSAQT